MVRDETQKYEFRQQRASPGLILNLIYQRKQTFLKSFKQGKVWHDRYDWSYTLERSFMTISMIGLRDRAEVVREANLRGLCDFQQTSDVDCTV